MHKRIVSTCSMMSDKGSALIFIVIIIILLIGGLSLALIFGRNDLFDKTRFSLPAQMTYQNEFLKANLPKLITSGSRSYPLLVEKSKEDTREMIYNLLIIPITDGASNPIETGIAVEGGGFSLYQGSKDPLASPDLKIIAYIAGNKLGLISADGKNKVELPDALKVEYITGWSADSRKILVYSLDDNIQAATGRMGGPPDEIQFDPLRWPGGFYLVDLTKGEIKLIPQLNGVDKWIDSDKVLAVTRSSGDRYEVFVIFDLNSYIADYKTFAESLSRYFGKQFSFSQDGKKWALSLGNTGNELGVESFENIIIADFPGTQGIEIDKGKWADVQHPLISPDGEKVVYSRGANINSFVIWSDNKIIEGGNGIPRMWIDNDKFIYIVRTEGQSSKIYIYNTVTQSDTLLNP